MLNEYRLAGDLQQKQIPRAGALGMTAYFWGVRAIWAGRGGCFPQNNFWADMERRCRAEARRYDTQKRKPSPFAS